MRKSSVPLCGVYPSSWSPTHQLDASRPGWHRTKQAYPATDVGKGGGGAADDVLADEGLAVIGLLAGTAEDGLAVAGLAVEGLVRLASANPSLCSFAREADSALALFLRAFHSALATRIRRSSSLTGTQLVSVFMAFSKSESTMMSRVASMSAALVA